MGEFWDSPSCLVVVADILVVPGTVYFSSGDIIPISSRSMPLIGIISPEFLHKIWCR